jgi:dienelactone hydrolase
VTGKTLAKTFDVSYEAEGVTMVGRMAVPDGSGLRPGILIAHEATGLDDHQRARAERFADEFGYVAFALDYVGGGSLVTGKEMAERIGPLAADVERVRAVGKAGLDVLVAEPRTDPERVAAIGYCFGGTMALELGRSGADLVAVVGFHSGLSTTRPQDAADMKAKVLVCLGADDPIVPPAQRSGFEEEMRAGGVDWQMHLYGNTKHSFTRPNANESGFPGVEYDAVADARSWRAMLDLLGEVFG